MEILLTGATGFIGSQVARLLVARGHTVHIIVRPGSDLWRIADLPALIPHTGRLESQEDIERIVRSVRPQSCFHLAWSPGEGTPTAFVHLDFAHHSLRLAQAVAESGCEQFVSTGTVFEYDCAPGRLSEQTSTQPLTVYAASKLAVYTGLHDIERRFPMRSVWLRPFVLYGPLDDSRRLIPVVIRALRANQVLETSPGTQLRDFLHGADAAAGICAAAEHRLPVVNLGAGSPVPVRDVILKIAAILQKQDLLRLGAREMRIWEPSAAYSDNSLLRSTGWQPQFDLDSGLEDTVRWWATQPA